MEQTGAGARLPFCWRTATFQGLIREKTPDFYLCCYCSLAEEERHFCREGPYPLPHKRFRGGTQENV